MKETTESRHPISEAREFALQFLYQMESDKLFYFSTSHFEMFVSHFEVNGRIISHMRRVVEGVFKDLDTIDDEIVKATQNWSIERMSTVDRSLLRIAVHELLEHGTPPKVVLNEAIDLAKKFGSEQSGAFVNGILVTVAKNIGVVDLN